MKIYFVLCILSLTVTLLTAKHSLSADKVFLDTSGTKIAADTKKTPIAISTSPIIRPVDNDNAVYSIRCWQNGQLIIEETNWTAPQLSSHYIAMRRTGSPAPGIYLVDMQHTLCELKQKQ